MLHSDLKVFREYRAHIEKMIPLIDEGQVPIHELLKYITRHCECSTNIAFYHSFFRGEFFFFSQKYRQALNFYLSSDLIPKQEFFCLRTAAYLYKEKGNTIKALSLAKRAEAIDTDFSNCKIIRLLQQNESLSPLQTIDEQKEVKMFSLGEEERNALHELFIPK